MSAYPLRRYTVKYLGVSERGEIGILSKRQAIPGYDEVLRASAESGSYARPQSSLYKLAGSTSALDAVEDGAAARPETAPIGSTGSAAPGGGAAGSVSAAALGSSQSGHIITNFMPRRARLATASPGRRERSPALGARPATSALASPTAAHIFLQPGGESPSAPGLPSNHMSLSSPSKAGPSLYPSSEAPELMPYAVHTGIMGWKLTSASRAAAAFSPPVSDSLPQLSDHASAPGSQPLAVGTFGRANLAPLREPTSSARRGAEERRKRQRQQQQKQQQEEEHESSTEQRPTTADDEMYLRYLRLKRQQTGMGKLESDVMGT